MGRNVQSVGSRTMNVGENIRNARKAKGMTQAQLAEAIGATQSYVWQIERMHTTNICVSTVIKFAGALGVPVAELVKENEQ